MMNHTRRGLSSDSISKIIEEIGKKPRTFYEEHSKRNDESTVVFVFFFHFNNTYVKTHDCCC